MERPVTILKRLPTYATGLGFAIGLAAVAEARHWGGLTTLGAGLVIATFYVVLILVPHLIREQQAMLAAPKGGSPPKTDHASSRSTARPLTTQVALSSLARSEWVTQRSAGVPDVLAQAPSFDDFGRVPPLRDVLLHAGEDWGKAPEDENASSSLVAVVRAEAEAGAVHRSRSDPTLVQISAFMKSRTRTTNGAGQSNELATAVSAH
jgi:hypothetical protein